MSFEDLNKGKERGLFELESSWRAILRDELQKPYISELERFVAAERRSGKEIYPPPGQELTALDKTPYRKVKVVIIGQDPYHGPGQAHGLSFSVNRTMQLPPSLKNVYKELESDLAIPPPSHGCLEKWAEEGVLLLNATLTVCRSAPMSHHGRGWERFTDAIVRALLLREEPMVFLLWGKSAEEKCKEIKKSSIHRALSSVHPSPLSAYRGFFGCRHFSRANELLISMGREPVDWSIS